VTSKRMAQSIEAALAVLVPRTGAPAGPMRAIDGSLDRRLHADGDVPDRFAPAGTTPSA